VCVWSLDPSGSFSRHIPSLSSIFFFVVFFFTDLCVCVCVSVGTVDRQQRLSVNGSLCGRSSVDSGGADRSVTTLSSSCPFSSSPSRFPFYFIWKSVLVHSLFRLWLIQRLLCVPPLNSLGNQLAPRFFSFFLFSFLSLKRRKDLAEEFQWGSENKHGRFNNCQTDEKREKWAAISSESLF
jgi:hypothetical protein